MEDYAKRVEKLVATLAAEAVARLEKKKKLELQDLVILTAYLNIKQMAEVREQLDNMMRAFQRLDALLDVVKQLKAAVDSLQKTHDAELLKEIKEKLDLITVYTREE
ncbi:MAG: hypothetical protein ACK4SY_04115 [Pyrobaculum sp.]